MKYVHLTSMKNIGLIKKHGICMGGGGVRRGVYAVPLTTLRFEGLLDPPMWSGLKVAQLGGGRAMSTKLWKQTLRSRNVPRCMPEKLAAVVFTIPQHCWPVHITIDSDTRSSALVAAKLILSRPLDYILGDVERTSYKEYVDNDGCDEFVGEAGLWINVEVSNSRAMSLLWSTVFQDQDVSDDCTQVVVPKPIPASCIVKIMPMYRDNKSFKKKTWSSKLDDLINLE